MVVGPHMPSSNLSDIPHPFPERGNQSNPGEMGLFQYMIRPQVAQNGTSAVTYYVLLIARRTHSHMRDNKLQHKRGFKSYPDSGDPGQLEHAVFQHRSVDRKIGLVWSS